MMFGCGEEYRHRVNHFERHGAIQKIPAVFTAFIPWMFAPENTPLEKKFPGDSSRLLEDFGHQPPLPRQH